MRFDRRVRAFHKVADAAQRERSGTSPERETRQLGTDLESSRLAEANLVEARLDWSNLDHADLTNGDLRGASLVAASLRQARLANAGLQGAKLTKARMQGANLNLAKLQKADLSETRLHGANLREADLSGVRGEQAMLYGADLTRAVLHEAWLRGAYFSEANLTGADFSQAYLGEADLQRATLDSAVLRGAIMPQADLRKAALRGAVLARVRLVSATLREADLHDADLSGAYCLKADFRDADLTQVNLSGADLTGALLTAAKLTGAQCDESTRLPDGSLWTPGTDLARFTRALPTDDASIDAGDRLPEPDPGESRLDEWAESPLDRTQPIQPITKLRLAELTQNQAPDSSLMLVGRTSSPAGGYYPPVSSGLPTTVNLDDQDDERVDPAPAAKPTMSATGHHIRGSSLLLLGKILAQVLDFGGQVLLVRYLTKADYGAFSYALSVALLAKGIAMFGLPDTISRFVPLYRERGQRRAVLGTILMAFLVVLGAGVLIAGGLAAGVSLLGFKPTNDPQALHLLVVLAFLVPIEALDGLLMNLFAAFASPRVIFFRQSVLAPCLRMGLVLILIWLQAPVMVLTGGYLLISLVGVVLYLVMFVQILNKQGLLQGWQPRTFEYPVREIFTFAIPLLASVMVWLVIESSDALMLGYFQNTEAVATFRAVLPMARLNQGVILTFALLYMPLASRLYARSEHKELGDLYWQTALWMTILSMPIFYLTFCFARSMTIGVYGSQYSDSVTIMSLLSFGYFFHTSLGFNGLTLKVYNRLRYTVTIDVIATILNVIINLALIPHLGALGAAIGTTITLFIHNVLKQVGLHRHTGIELFRRRYIGAYAAVVSMAVILTVLQAVVLPVNVWLSIVLAGVASLLVLFGARHALDIDQIFPELTSWPVVGSFLRPASRVSS
jgi:uncharacterized protein YjbI with pentapeptide repeats/O-antigen/teichoic acid export membrane protein